MACLWAGAYIYTEPNHLVTYREALLDRDGFAGKIWRCHVIVGL